MTLRSDGLTRGQFLPLWRDAMWHAVDPLERARLMMELGRLTVREERRASPLAAAWVAGREPPLVLLALPELPCAQTQPLLRASTRDRLEDLAASELYLMFTLQTRSSDGVPGYLLAVWGETVAGEQACIVQPFRWVGPELEEAQQMVVPAPGTTEIARRVAGLLTIVH